MKNIVTIISLFITMISSSLAQAPQAINYQGVARDASGNELANTNISLRLNILDGSAAGATIYQEEHSVTTNEFGLFSLQIGTGTATIGTFSSIDWGVNTRWLEVEMDPLGGTSYVNMGTSQLVSVPYALYAETSGSGASSVWEQNASDIYYDAGNVGIGVNSPKAQLEVTGKSYFGDLLTGGSNTSLISDPTVNINRNLVSTSAEANILQITAHSSADGVTGDAGALIIGSTDVPGLGSIFLSSNDETTSGIGFKTRNATGEDYRMVINADGEVGIGTNSPSAPLNISSNVSGTAFIELNDSEAAGSHLKLRDATALTNGFVPMIDGKSVGTGVTRAGLLVVGKLSDDGVDDKGIAFRAWANDSDPITTASLFEWQSGNNVMMDMNANGNLGIGTETPGDHKLNIEIDATTGQRNAILLNNISNGTGSSIGLQLQAGTDGEFGAIGFGASSYTINPQYTGSTYIANTAQGIVLDCSETGASTRFTFRNGGATSVEYMRIDSDGEVGVGTADPRSKLHISSGDVYIDNSANGVILTSPNGSCFRVTVDNAGSLSATSITCP